MVTLDETSSPTSPSSSDVSIVAGASRRMISKVGVLANDTMPGTRRARRTPEVMLPKPAAAASDVDRAAAETKPNQPLPETRPSRELTIDSESNAGLSVEAKFDTLELADPTLASRRRVRWGLGMIAFGGICALIVWLGGAPAETVRVEQIKATATSLEPAPAPVLAPPAAAENTATPPAPATAAATVVPVTTVPAEKRERVPVSVSVNRQPAAEQVIAPVVPSAMPTAAPPARNRETIRNARSSVRRNRESAGARSAISAARPSDVIPNPYHD